MATWPALLLFIAAGCALSACVDGFDSANGSDQAWYRLNDYVIDRPRVLGITYWPPMVSGGETVTFTALAATPSELVNPEIRWYGCGTHLNEPFAYYGADCLETSLAEYLGKGKSLSLTLPHYDLSICEDTTACVGYLPVFAIVEEPDAPIEEGYGVTFLVPDYAENLQGDDLPGLAGENTLSLLANGLSASPVHVSKGSRVDLEALVTTTDVDVSFYWYVSEGKLENLGLTRAEEIIPVWRTDGSLMVGRNVLEIPKEPSQARLIVYVVTTPVTYLHPSLLRFTTLTLEVER